MRPSHRERTENGPGMQPMAEAPFRDFGPAQELTGTAMPDSGGYLASLCLSESFSQDHTPQGCQHGWALQHLRASEAARHGLTE